MCGNDGMSAFNMPPKNKTKQKTNNRWVSVTRVSSKHKAENNCTL